MRTQRHICLSVRGVLRKSDRELVREFKGCITDESGRKLTTAGEIREAFLDELAQGHEVVPFGKLCEGFDYKKGCPGHPIEDSKGGAA